MSLDMNLEDEKVVIQTDEGDLVYKVALTFECPENGKSYVGFTDDKIVNNKGEIFFACYPTDAFTGDLYEIETPEEFELINSVMDTLNQGGRK